MMWHIYRSIAVGHARVGSRQVDPAKWAEDVLKIESARLERGQLVGAYIAVSGDRGTSRFKIVERPDGTLGLEGSR